MYMNLELHFNKWADKFYLMGEGVNKGFEKHSLRDDFLLAYPRYRSTLTMRGFKKLLLAYCKKWEFEFNPHRGGGRDKSHRTEYYFVTNMYFDAGRLHRYIANDRGKK